MKIDDRPGRRLGDHPAGDYLGRRPLPVARVDRPQHRRPEILVARDPRDALGVLAVGRPHEPRTGRGRLLDRLAAARQLVAELIVGKPAGMPVAEEVVAKLVPAGELAAQNSLAPCDRPAEHEERGARTVLVEEFEDGGSNIPGPVVEGEREQRLAGGFDAADDRRFAHAHRIAAGMVLADRTIRKLLEQGRIEIDPYDESLLQPSSVDVRVDRLFRVFHNARYPYIDVRERQEDLTELVEIGDDAPFILHPGEFVLGSTLERVRLPDDLVARLEGKSSLGRLGLLIHSTAGFIDPGWDGHVTLELQNGANLPITIYYGMKIGQLSFVQLTEAAETPYGTGSLGSKYQGQRGPTPSRYWQNFRQEDSA